VAGWPPLYLRQESWLNYITRCKGDVSKLFLVLCLSNFLDSGDTHLVVVVAADLIRHPALQDVGGLISNDEVGVHDALLHVRRDDRRRLDSRLVQLDPAVLHQLREVEVGTVHTLDGLLEGRYAIRIEHHLVT